jgi:hypothetical protein
MELSVPVPMWVEKMRWALRRLFGYLCVCMCVCVCVCVCAFVCVGVYVRGRVCMSV